MVLQLCVAGATFWRIETVAAGLYHGLYRLVLMSAPWQAEWLYREIFY
jgi:hypothetical protein